MVNVGTEATFVDTQGISLTNTTDSKTYLQLTDVKFHIDSNVTKHQRTDNIVDNVFSLQMGFIEANITLTTGEITDLVTLTKDVSGVRPKKVWTLAFNNSSNGNVSIAFGGAQLKILSLVDLGISVSTMFLRIEASENVSVA